MRVNLVLSGHKHVPYAWRLEDLFVVNTGTCCSLRLRGNIKPCYNVITIDADRVEVVRKSRSTAPRRSSSSRRRPSRSRRTRAWHRSREPRRGRDPSARRRLDRRRALPARGARDARRRLAAAFRACGGAVPGGRREAARPRRRRRAGGRADEARTACRWLRAPAGRWRAARPGGQAAAALRRAAGTDRRRRGRRLVRRAGAGLSRAFPAHQRGAGRGRALRRGRLRVRAPAAGASRQQAVAGHHRYRQAGGQDGGERPRGAASRAAGWAPTRVVVLAMGRGGPPQPELVDGRRGLARRRPAGRLAPRRPCRVGLLRGRAARRCDDHRLPALRRRHGRRRLRQQRARGAGRCWSSSRPRWRCSRAAGR